MADSGINPESFLNQGTLSTPPSSLFSDALYEHVRLYQGRARELLSEYENQLPRPVAHFLDDLAVVIADAQREAMEE